MENLKGQVKVYFLKKVEHELPTSLLYSSLQNKELRFSFKLILSSSNIFMSQLIENMYNHAEFFLYSTSAIAHTNILVPLIP